jgi:2-oxoacid:acceptor oxidoreductase gamma subunit (pyruvate/2-ketoisovalerate family)
MKEIKFHGRGGQGVVMASQMLGLAYFKAGMYPQCYSLFGGERRGAPVVSFLRVDRKKILLKCEIRHPDELLCFDGSLLNPEEIRSTMRPGGRILINAAGLPKSLEGIEGFTLACINAGAVAEGLGLGRVINTTVLGAYCKLNTEIDLDRVIEAVTEMVPAKKEINVEAIRRGYESVRLWTPSA